MDYKELTTRMHSILVEYEAGERGAQRSMELITALFNAVGEDWDALSKQLKQIRLAVQAWNQGDRPDADVLATISALERQFRGARGR